MTKREYLSTLSNKELAEGILAIVHGAMDAYERHPEIGSVKDIIERFLGSEK